MTTQAESSDDFARAFAVRHGRAPRALHLGNVANNAYHNAKLMRRAGVESDVVSYDYYHVMGCPEWEDADFQEPPADQFRPEWWKVDLHGFARPRWFAQGTRGLCIRYLEARNARKDAAADRYWELLRIVNGTRAAANLVESGIRWLVEHAARAEMLYRRVVAQPETWAVIRRKTRGLQGRVGGLVMLVVALPLYSLAKAVRAVDAAATTLTGSRKRRKDRVRAVLQQYASQFPDRTDKLDAAEVEYQLRIAEDWRGLFAQYDVVQAYATDAILPFLCGTPYFALEHGTLRDIPYEPTTIGQLTSLAYRNALHVFVTNADCMPSARYLAGSRMTFITHPFDESFEVDSARAREARRALERQLGATFLFFFPTRHDWTRGNSDKANDVFLRAFCRLRKAGHAVGLVCCEWGGDVEASKRLIAEQGCSSAVCWESPMGIIRFARMARACDLVVDQFRLSGVAGVLFKSFACGAPVMTYLEEAGIMKVFAEMPPVVNCRTEDQIVAATERLLDDRQALARLGADSRTWIEAHHNGSVAARRQIARYEEMILTKETGNHE